MFVLYQIIDFWIELNVTVVNIELVCIVMLNSALYLIINSLAPRQNGRHFADDIFNRIFFNENL